MHVSRFIGFFRADILRILVLPKGWSSRNVKTLDT